MKFESRLKSSIVRIFSNDRQVVGVGFLISEKYIITCAHVVYQALNVDNSKEDIEKQRINLDFPLIAPDIIITANVKFCDLSESNDKKDIALLEITNDLPKGAFTVNLIFAKDLWAHPFKVFGFPAGQDDGVWASGLIRGHQASGWIQIEDIKQSGYRIEQGFSGAPIWDEYFEGVVGMAVAAERKPEIKAAFMIPSDLILHSLPILEEFPSELIKPIEEHAFISYARGNSEEFATKIRDKLEIEGFKTWLDIYDIKAGEDKDKKIDYAIKNCWVLIFIATKISVSSEYCHDEWSRAISLKKTVLPLILEPLMLPFRLHRRQSVDFTTNFNLAMDKLLQTLLWLRSPEGELENLRNRLIDIEKESDLTSNRIKSEMDILQSQISYKEQYLKDPEKFQTEYQNLIEEGIKKDKELFSKYRELDRSITLRRVIGSPPLGIGKALKDRTQEMAVITNLLLSKEDDIRVVSIYGRAGSGKTTLACGVMADLENDYLNFQGLIYLSTRSGLGINLERLFLDCARLMGGKYEQEIIEIWTDNKLNVEAKIQIFLEKCLEQNKYLILLDNLEDLLSPNGHFIDADMQLFINSFLRSRHNSKLLITSRKALNLDNDIRRYERIFPLGHGLPIEDAIDLLKDLDKDNYFGLSDAEEIILRKIADKTLCLPRALEAVVGILAQDPFLSISELLKNEELFKKEIIETLISEAQSHLSTDERRVMQALAVFNRPATQAAVQFLLEPYVTGIDIPNTLRQLARGLFITVKRNTGEIFLHPLDREYNYHQISTNEDENFNRKNLELRTSEYYHNISTSPDSWSSIEDLEPQLIQFQHLINGKDYDNAAKLIDRIDLKYLSRWGHSPRVLSMRSKLLGKIVDRNLECNNLIHLGLSCYVTGQENRAVELYKQGMAIARELKDRNKEINCLIHLGRATRHLAQYEESINYFKKALKLAKKIEDRHIEGICLHNLGNAYRNIGNFKRSLYYLKKSLVVSREFNDKQQEGLDMHHIGFGYAEMGNFKLAKEYHKKAYSIALEMGDRRRQSSNLGLLGYDYAGIGEYNTSIEFYQRAISMAREIGDRRREGSHIGNLGSAMAFGGEYLKAIEYFEEALEIAREVNDKRRESNILARLGFALKSIGEYEKSISNINAGLSIAIEIGAKNDEGFLLLSLGDVFISLMDYKRAYDFFNKALEIAEQTQNPKDLYDCYIKLAQTLLHLGQLSNAFNMITKAFKIKISQQYYFSYFIHGLILAKLDKINIANQSFIKALNYSNKMLSKSNKNYYAKYTKALALSGLVILSKEDESKGLLEQVHKAFIDANENCDEKGIVNDYIRILKELKSIDKHEMLKLESIIPESWSSLLDK